MPMENELTRVAPLPRTLIHSRLFRVSNARRLFKARHLELEQITLRTRIVQLTVEEGVAPFTIYRVLVRHRNTSRLSLPDSSETLTPWVIEHRYSEFYAFRHRLLKLIQSWEASADLVEQETKEFMAMSNALRRPFTHDFPRRRFRLETPKIIEERCIGLQEFTHRLLTAYVDVSVYLQECTASMSTASHSQMEILARELEAFINVPPSQKELERYLTAAIRALIDVDEVRAPEASGEAHEGYECCICMNNEDEENVIERIPGEDKLVRLPCTHHFHEDCVIDWFSTSMTCPLCRQDVVRTSL